MKPSRPCVWTVAAVVATFITAAVPAVVQMTTATLSGLVKDSSNGGTN